MKGGKKRESLMVKIEEENESNRPSMKAPELKDAKLDEVL